MHQQALSLLQQRRPNAYAALVAAAKAIKNPDDRKCLDAIIAELFLLMIDCNKKTLLAKEMLMLRVGHAPDPTTGSTSSHALRHMPDVMIRMLAEIAEVPALSNAPDEYIQRLRERADAHTRPID